jgi:hypothetical protein
VLSSILENVREAQPGFWLDMICINQHSLAHKNAQVSVMGSIFACGTTIVLDENCGPHKPVSEYWSRAWTQQEFHFGSVKLAYLAETSTLQEMVDLDKTFEGIDCYGCVTSIVFERQKGTAWAFNVAEDWRAQKLKEDAATTHDMISRAILTAMWNHSTQVINQAHLCDLFRLLRFCSSYYGHASDETAAHLLARTLRLKCHYPKDQLYGMWGVPMMLIHRTRLDYTNPSHSWTRVLECHGFPNLSGLREFDSMCSQRDFTPGFWIHNNTSNSTRPEDHLTSVECAILTGIDKMFTVPARRDGVCVVVFRSNDGGKCRYGFAVTTKKSIAERSVQRAAVCVEAQLIEYHENRGIWAFIMTMLQSEYILNSWENRYMLAKSFPKAEFDLECTVV